MAFDWRVVRIAAVAIWLGACQFTGPPQSLLEQRLTWFSYLNADDIRANCAPGAADQYRIVYNADYAQQARAYDIYVLPDGSAGVLQTVDRGLVGAGTGNNLTTIGAPLRVQTMVGPSDVAALLAALTESGTFGPAPAGLRLDSHEFYWLATGCRDGAMFIHAWRYPSPGFDAVTFDDHLQRLDQTGVRFLDPRRDLDPSRRACRQGGQGDDRQRLCFSITIGEDGLVGI